MAAEPQFAPPRYMAIEGPIRVGKSTLARILADRLHARLLADRTDNPYLGDFYAEKPGAAFRAQMHFLLMRFRQLHDLALEHDPRPLLCDYLFEKDRIFAALTLTDEELKVYEQYYEYFRPQLRTPDLVIYLQATPAVLRKRMKKTAAASEREISDAYLEAVVEAYEHFFVRYTGSDLLVINTSEIDFVELHEDLRELLRRLSEPVKGTQYFLPLGPALFILFLVASGGVGVFNNHEGRHPAKGLYPEDNMSTHPTPQGSGRQAGSANNGAKKVTVPDIISKKTRGEKISCLTAYDYPTARLLDAAGVDISLVGDSLGMVVLGYENTLPVTMEEMLHHTRAARRGTARALLVADMPFGSFQLDVNAAVANAVRFVKEAGAEAVKIEGGGTRLELIARPAENDIPVMAHIGLTPQSVHALGGFKVQGKTLAAADALLRDARAVEAAGAFSLVLESIPAEVAERITRELKIPTIGIGAGPACDGQVLVWHDLIGLSFGVDPKFVRRYAH